MKVIHVSEVVRFNTVLPYDAKQTFKRRWASTSQTFTFLSTRRSRELYVFGLTWLSLFQVIPSGKSAIHKSSFGWERAQWATLMDPPLHFLACTAVANKMAQPMSTSWHAVVSALSRESPGIWYYLRDPEFPTSWVGLMLHVSKCSRNWAYLKETDVRSLTCDMLWNYQTCRTIDGTACRDSRKSLNLS